LFRGRVAVDAAPGLGPCPDETHRTTPAPVLHPGSACRSAKRSMPLSPKENAGRARSGCSARDPQVIACLPALMGARRLSRWQVSVPRAWLPALRCRQTLPVAGRAGFQKEQSRCRGTIDWQSRGSRSHRRPYRRQPSRSCCWREDHLTRRLAAGGGYSCRERGTVALRNCGFRNGERGGRCDARGCSDNHIDGR